MFGVWRAGFGAWGLWLELGLGMVEYTKTLMVPVLIMCFEECMNQGFGLVDGHVWNLMILRLVLYCVLNTCLGTIHSMTLEFMFFPKVL